MIILMRRRSQRENGRLIMIAQVDHEQLFVQSLQAGCRR